MPGIHAYRYEYWHPESAPEARVSARDRSVTGVFAFAGMVQARDDSDVTSEGGGIRKARRITGLADYGGRSEGAHALDSGEQFSEVVRVDPALNFGFESASTFAHLADVLAGVANLQFERCGLEAADRLLCGYNQSTCECGTYSTPTIEAFVIRDSRISNAEFQAPLFAPG